MLRNQGISSLQILLALGLLIGSCPFAWAQLDTLHFIPPCHARSSPGNHYLYLTTPEVQPFPVIITNGTGGAVNNNNGQPIDTIWLSNATPRSINLGNGANPANGLVTLTTAQQLNVPLNGKGLRIQGARPFYANFRARTVDHALSLTAKGTRAAGTRFRIGHIFNQVPAFAGYNVRSNFVGVVATRDSTWVTFSGFAAGMTLAANGPEITPSGPISTLLMAGQSYVISTYVQSNRPPENANGMQGLLVEATAPIVVNCGSWLGSPYTNGVQDMGIDQIVPESLTGTEYITIRGDGPNTLETPVIIATQDNTEIFLKGGTIPVATLNAGDYHRVAPGAYTPEENLYIRATKPVYVYQMLGGAMAEATGGLNFVPPISCSEQGSVNHIMDIERIGATVYEGKLLILAQAGKTVWVNGNPLAANQLKPVAGKPGYLTAKIPNLTGNIRVDSDGSLQVGVFGRNNNAGWGGYYSGFDQVRRPEIALERHPACSDTLRLTNSALADSLLWFYNGLPIADLKDTLIGGAAPGTYYAVAIRDFCDERLADTSAIIFIPPPVAISTDIQAAYCQDEPGGRFTITNITGGVPPYNIALDPTLPYGQATSRDSLIPGLYTILIRDADSCIHSFIIDIPYQPANSPFLLLPPDTLNCLRDTILLQISGTPPADPYSLQWQAPDGQIIPDDGQFSLKVTQGGLYTLAFIDSSRPCPILDSVEVLVDRARPEITLSAPLSLNCLQPAHPVEVQIHFPTNIPLQFEWYLDNQLRLKQEGLPSFMLTQPGAYVLITRHPGNGCLDTFAFQVSIDTLRPAATITLPSLLTCSDTLAALTCTPLSAATNWHWILPHAGSGPDSNQTTVYTNQPGTAQLILVDTLNGCRDTLLLPIDQDTIPPLATVLPVALLTCSDTLVTLEAQVSDCPGCQALWQGPENGLQGTPSELLVWATLPGMYTLQLQNTINGCVSMDSIQVLSAPLLESVLATVEDLHCQRNTGTILLSQVSGGTPPYTYSFDGGASFSPQAIRTETPPGAYMLMVKDAYGCQVSTSIEIKERVPLLLDLTPSLTLRYGESVQLELSISQPLSQIASIQWSPESGLSCTTCVNPLASPEAPTIYSVLVTDLQGCTAVASIRVDVTFEGSVYIPNAFHPDGDGINDGFTLYGDPRLVERIVLMQVFDRWGNALFEHHNFPLNDPLSGWNGQFRGREMDPGVYVYQAEVELIQGVRLTFKGEIILLR